MDYVVFDNSTSIKNACKEALNHHLYVDGFMFQRFYKLPEIISKILIVYDENKPIAISMIWDYQKYNFLYHGMHIGCFYHGMHIGCFVKEEYRRKGIGEKMIKILEPDETIQHGYGIYGSELFWKKVRNKQSVLK